jgi:hypothetical protein
MSNYFGYLSKYRRNILRTNTCIGNNKYDTIFRRAHNTMNNIFQVWLSMEIVILFGLVELKLMRQNGYSLLLIFHLL